MEEVEKKEVEEVETIEEEKQDLGWGQQEGREAKELPREELVPIAQLLAKHNIFDVDASHSFEECADAAVRLGTLSQVERHGMAALVESGRRSDRFMSATLWPNLAHVLGVSGWYAPATDYSPRTHGTWHDESGRFSLAVCLQPLVTTRWERLKDLGNEALKAGEPEVALTWYERAATLCSGPADYVETFFATLQERKERKGRRAAKRLVEKIEAITPHLRRQMPDAPAILEIERDEQAVQSGAPMHAYEPNLPLATCLANKAAAELECARRIKKVSDGYMRDHLLQSAMEAAVKATLMCPEYIKGYYRLKQVRAPRRSANPNRLAHSSRDRAAPQVLTAMATSSPNGEEERNQAERISKMIAFYEQIGPSLPWSGMTCVLTGWLTWSARAHRPPLHGRASGPWPPAPGLLPLASCPWPPVGHRASPRRPRRHEYARAYEPAYVAHELRLLKHEILKEANAQTKVNVTVTGDPQRGGVTRTAAEKPPSALSLVVLASLVAVHGGQWLLLSVEVSAKGLDGANVDGMRHDGLSFVPVDSANGKLVEQTPPRGSKAALER